MAKPPRKIRSGKAASYFFDNLKKTLYLCTVKYFCYIFALYFLALNLMPCADMNVADEGNVTECVSEEHNEHQHDACHDLCSPFCSCACCGQVLMSNKVYKFIVQNQLIRNNFTQKVTFFHTADWSSQYLKEIFQPPRFLS